MSPENLAVILTLVGIGATAGVALTQRRLILGSIAAVSWAGAAALLLWSWLGRLGAWLGGTGFVIAVVVFLWLLWRRKRGGPLQFEGMLIQKLRPPESIVGQKKIAAALSYPHFAAISVENNGRRNLGSLIARVEIEGDEQPAYGAWLSEPPTSFAPLSDDGIGLAVGAKRLLLLAVTHRPRRTREPDTSWILVSSRFDAHHHFDRERLAQAGTNLGRQPRFRIRFRAEGVDQSISVRLSSTPDGEPAIKVEP